MKLILLISAFFLIVLVHCNDAGLCPSWLPYGETGEWKNGNPPVWTDLKILDLPDSIFPPEYDKWDSDKQEKWNAEYEQARKRIYLRKEHCPYVSFQTMKSALLSLRCSALSGAPIHHIARIITRCMEKNYDGKDIEKITRAISHAALKKVCFSQLADKALDKIMVHRDSNLIAREIYLHIRSSFISQHESHSELQ